MPVIRLWAVALGVIAWARWREHSRLLVSAVAGATASLKQTLRVLSAAVLDWLTVSELHHIIPIVRRLNVIAQLADPSGGARGCQCCSWACQYAVLRRICVANKQWCPHEYGRSSWSKSNGVISVYNMFLKCLGICGAS